MNEKLGRIKGFFGQVWSELRFKVTWPSRKEMFSSFIIVVFFIVFWATYIGLWDLLFTSGLNLLVK